MLVTVGVGESGSEGPRLTLGSWAGGACGGTGSDVALRAVPGGNTVLPSGGFCLQDLSGSDNSDPMATSNFVTTPETAHATLAYLESLFKLKAPPPIPKMTGNVGAQISYSHSVLSVRAAANIGYGGIFSASSEGRSMLLVMDYMRKTFVPGEDPNRVLLGVTYGAGFRVLLAVMEVKGEFELSLAGVAAQAQLGIARVDLKIDILGLPDVPPGTVDPTLLSFESYDVKVHDVLTQTIAKLTKYAEETTNCHPQLVGLTTRTIVDSGVKDQATSVLFAMRRICRRTSLAHGLEVAEQKGLPINREVVRATYAEHLRNSDLLIPDKTRDNMKPSQDDATRAESFLSIYRDL